METKANASPPTILDKAWQQHAELDQNSSYLGKRYLRLRQWIAILGVFATFLAIFIDVTGMLETPPNVYMAAGFKFTLILTPLLASALAAFTSREIGDGRWLAMRAGAEEIAKEIYIYRTVLRHNQHRNRWLSNRLAVILRQVYKSSNNKLDTVPYKGDTPINYRPDDPNSDPGFIDLSPDDYIRYRLLDQLDWHERKLIQIRRSKWFLTSAILAMGVLGALLAGLGGSLAVWVALTSSLTASLTGWEELRNREATIANYSKVKLELTILRDYWYGLLGSEKTDAAFYKLVLATENLLWAQNSEYIRSMQEALATVEDEDAKLVEDVIRKSESLHKGLQEDLYAETVEVLEEAQERLSAVIEDAGDTVDQIVADTAQEAKAYTDSVAAVSDSARAASAAVRTHVETTTTAEVTAWGDAAETAVDDAAGQSAELRDRAAAAAAAETDAWTDSGQAALDTAAAQAAAARQLADQEVKEWADSSQAALDAAAATSDAAQAAVNSEVGNWQTSAENVIDTAVDQSTTVRDSAERAAADQTDAWADTAQDTLDTAVSQSEAAQQLARQEADAWAEASQETLAAAAATSDAARKAAGEEVAAWQKSGEAAIDTAAAESAAWRDSTETVIETAVDKSSELRQSTEIVAKHTIEFMPVTISDEALAEFQETIEEVVYQATPDVKYPITITPPPDSDDAETTNNIDSEPETAIDDTVNDAVDRLLEEGVNVADEAIKDALAKANQEDG